MKDGWNYEVRLICCYRLCTYEAGPSLDRRMETPVPSIQEAKVGFWIDQQGICTTLRTVYRKDLFRWIPPSQVLYVRDRTDLDNF